MRIAPALTRISRELAGCDFPTIQPVLLTQGGFSIFEEFYSVSILIPIWVMPKLW